MTGRVDAQKQATLRLQVFGPSGQSLEATAVIDTGYNGKLTLPIATITALALTPDVTRRVRLADTTRRVLNCFAAEILWAGQRRRILVLEVEGDPLVGTALLDGHRLEIDFVDGDAVSINPLP
jgi:clan AA aspartic protease